jgi:hypothetical protein
MRIRSIHPEFWRSEDVAAMDWSTRLVFIGLWSYVDDNGVGRDVEKLIASELFPLEDDPRDTLATLSRALQTLSDGGQIVRYTVDGKPLLFIAAWSKWQRIDRPGKERYKLPTCTDAVIRETLATPSRESSETPATGEGEKGRRGEVLLSAEADDDEPDLFADFYAAYPRKEARRKAEQAWRAATKRTDPAVIMAGLEKFQFSPDRHYIPLPASWLNAERWADETSNVHPIRPDDPHAGKKQYAEMAPGQWQEMHPEGFYMGKRTEWR